MAALAAIFGRHGQSAALLALSVALVGNPQNSPTVVRVWGRSGRTAFVTLARACMGGYYVNSWREGGRLIVYETAEKPTHEPSHFVIECTGDFEMTEEAARAAAPEIMARVVEFSARTTELVASTRDSLSKLRFSVCGTCRERETNPRTFKKCTGCMSVKYCGAECQRLDWRAHKLNCSSRRS